MSLSLQFLGTGTSVGVPQIGCTCPTCLSPDPRDKRRRSGVYVCSDATHLVVDTPPEFRTACLELAISRVDAVLITHAHMDHIAGFDDVRRFNTLNGTRGADDKVVGAPLPCYAAPETIASLHQVFPYISEKSGAQGLYRPQILFTSVTDTFAVGDIRVTPLPVEHGETRTNGYLFAQGGTRFAYISDCHVIPEATLELIRGVDVLVLNCLRDTPHPTHLATEAALGYVARIGPARAWFTHLCHNLRHADFAARLPPGVEVAYDGLAIRR